MDGDIVEDPDKLFESEGSNLLPMAALVISSLLLGIVVAKTLKL